MLACRWPEEERATQLLPLTGVLSLPPASRGVFKVICWVVLWIAWASPRRMSVRWQGENGCLRGPGSWKAAGYLREPSLEEARMLNLVFLEQFVKGLPEATARWVRYHWPADLTATMTLAEDHLAVGPEAARWSVQPMEHQLQEPAAQKRGGGPVKSTDMESHKPLRTAALGQGPRRRGQGSSTHPRFGRDVPHFGKVSRGYTPRLGGHGLHTEPGPPKLCSARGVV